MEILNRIVKERMKEQNYRNQEEDNFAPILTGY